LLSQTFVQLADSLVDDFDLIELLTLLSDRCVELFEAGAAGILLADQRGSLQVIAASSEQARLLELFQLQNDEGPCLECFSTGAAITVHDLGTVERWPLLRRGPRDIEECVRSR
jgi:GAF domain-containing protein